MKETILLTRLIRLRKLVRHGGECAIPLEELQETIDLLVKMYSALISEEKYLLAAGQAAFDPASPLSDIRPAIDLFWKKKESK